MIASDKSSEEAGVESDDEIPFAALIDTIINHRILISTVVCLALLIGAAYAYLSPPIFQSAILIKVDDNKDVSNSRAGDPLSNMLPTLDDRSSAEGEIQVLGSKLVVSRAVDALKLYISARPLRLPFIGSRLVHHDGSLSEPGLFGFGHYTWGDESISVTDFDVPRSLEGQNFLLTAGSDGEYTLGHPALGAPVTGKVGEILEAQTAKGPVRLFVSSLKGNPGAGFNVNHYSRQLTIDAIQNQLKISEQGNKSSVLKATLESADPVQVAATINEIGRQYVRLNGDRKAVIAENSLTYLQRQLPVLKQQMEEAENAYNTYRDANSLLDSDEANRLLLKQTADANGQLLALRHTRDDLATTFSPSHPRVVAVDRQIAATQQFLEKLNDRTRSMPMAEQGALRLLRNVRVNTDLYTALRNNIEEMMLIKAGKAASVQLIDIADVPEQPVKPVKLLALAIALVLGLFFGIGLAMLLDRVFRGVTDTQEIEIETGLSVFATIPKSARQAALTTAIGGSAPRQAVLAAQFPKDPTVEALRILRSALQFTLVGARNNVVMIAGPLPGVGKSFLSANLATVLASGGTRVLLIDADLRKGYLHKQFGLDPGPGLADMLAGNRTLEATVNRQVFPNLDVLQGGPYPSTPAELLLRAKYREVIDEASKAYDIVLVDAPAVLAVSDAGAIAPAAGSIFLVSSYGQTRVGEIKESIKRLNQTGARVTGVLLNSVALHTANTALAGRYGSSAYVAHNYESAPD
ncbi:polysaccharide biosynthesis tyrosine autokinase [Caballeronia sp. LP006]|uniref:polysaccharide biosynthesis tyrosine autokinase n=1 Tax=unclassified Caballeronia TaxID=2646786 RepID=UPI0020286588|nr:MULTISPECIES: polysaccharide biosynthesis tyrosine autokinase [unclassified Caballeronia]MDR5828088.1 polysaccharide biosynthesis tyrosine autokinase [Caballeronia sp. LP006]